jgi:hypothetical protein
MGLERRGGRMFGLFLWGVKNVKGPGLKNLHKLLIINEIKIIKNSGFRFSKTCIASLRKKIIAQGLGKNPVTF